MDKDQTLISKKRDRDSRRHDLIQWLFFAIQNFQIHITVLFGKSILPFIDLLKEKVGFFAGE
jgi:hypothetical protein